ncbi:MAG TPA: hypothetical protein VGE74_26395 [Gemmata sp.]
MLRRSHGLARVSSFASFEEADAERSRLESLVRARVNPFQCGAAVHFWTHLGEPQLRDWLMDHGIEPPAVKKDGTTDWAAWWAAEHKRLGEEKRAAVWEALDKVRFYSVAARPARSVVYAVVKVGWEYNDERHVSYGDGGEVQTMYRRRASAEAACARLNVTERARWGDGGMFDIQYRVEARRDLFAEPSDNEGRREQLLSPEEVPFYEVIELELEDGNGPPA